MERIACTADASGEAARTRIVGAYDVERARAEGKLDKIAAFAARLCDAPIALVTLLGAEVQHTVARSGFEAEAIPHRDTFCQHAIGSGSLVEMHDTASDLRTRDNPFVTGDPHIRFYAGQPLVSPEGAVLGTVCVLDVKPRPDGLTTLQRDGLRLLASLAMHRLDERRTASARARTDDRVASRLAESENRFRILADAMPQMVWATRPDGFHDYYNARWYEFTGVPEGSTDGDAWKGMFHPDDQDLASAAWLHSLETGEPYQIEYRLRHRDGDYRWLLGRALPLRDKQGVIRRWYGTCTDVDAQKRAADEREVISHELSHRIKNIFAVIAGLVGFAGRSRPEFAPAAADLRDRITALGRAHDFVRPHSSRSLTTIGEDSLAGLLRTLVEPYQQASGDRVAITGDEVAIDDRSATPLALLFHELATNASKYGALSIEGGKVAVRIAAGEEIAIHWVETGGPVVNPPETIGGFGSQLIEMSAVRQLGGRVEHDWKREGLSVIVAVPRSALSRTG